MCSSSAVNFKCIRISVIEIFYVLLFLANKCKSKLKLSTVVTLTKATLIYTHSNLPTYTRHNIMCEEAKREVLINFRSCSFTSFLSVTYTKWWKNASNSFNERHFFISLVLINISSFSVATLKDFFSVRVMQCSLHLTTRAWKVVHSDMKFKKKSLRQLRHLNNPMRVTTMIANYFHVLLFFRYSFILPHDTHYAAHLHRYTHNKLTTFTAAFSPVFFIPWWC